MHRRFGRAREREWPERGRSSLELGHQFDQLILRELGGGHRRNDQTLEAVFEKLALSALRWSSALHFEPVPASPGRQARWRDLSGESIGDLLPDQRPTEELVAQSPLCCRGGATDRL